MNYRWRMQSLKTGWGIEAEPTPEGKKKLIQLRKQQQDKFKFCRIYKVAQLLDSTIEMYTPFKLTNRKFFTIFWLTILFFVV